MDVLPARVLRKNVRTSKTVHTHVVLGASTGTVIQWG